jgi:hypothetical protein
VALGDTGTPVPHLGAAQALVWPGELSCLQRFLLPMVPIRRQWRLCRKTEVEAKANRPPGTAGHKSHWQSWSFPSGLLPFLSPGLGNATARRGAGQASGRL